MTPSSANCDCMAIALHIGFENLYHLKDILEALSTMGLSEQKMKVNML